MTTYPLPADSALNQLFQNEGGIHTVACPPSRRALLQLSSEPWYTGLDRRSLYWVLYTC